MHLRWNHHLGRGSRQCKNMREAGIASKVTKKIDSFTEFSPDRVGVIKQILHSCKGGSGGW